MQVVTIRQIQSVILETSIFITVILCQAGLR